MSTTGVRSDRREEDGDVESPLLTMDGDVVGTPAYMPPEQALGDLDAMGPHSDVYAVGAMLYHLFAGHAPYVEPGMRLSNRLVWYLVQKGPPEPLAARARDVPAELIAICEKAMARAPGERYPDMHTLAEDLRAYLEHRVVGGTVGDAKERLDASPAEHRGFEWDYLANRADVSLATSEPTPGFPYAVAYAPDGELAAAAGGSQGDFGSYDHAVRIYEARTLELVKALEGHETIVWAMAFSPAGTELATVSRGIPNVIPSQVRVFDVASGELLAEHRNWRGMSSVALFPPGEHSGLRVVLGCSLYATGELDWYPGVLDLDYSADGTRLLAATARGELALLDTRTASMIALLQGHHRSATSVRFGVGERWVVSSGLDGTIRLWDLDGAQLEVLHGHDGVVTSLDVSPDRRRIVSGSFDRTVRTWDGQPGSAVTTLRGSGGGSFQYFSLVFGPDGERVAWRPHPKTVRVSDARSGLELFTLPTLRFTPDGERVVSGHRDGAIVVRDAATGEELRRMQMSWVGDFAISPRGDVLAAVPYLPEDRSIWLWDLATGEQLRSLTGKSKPAVVGFGPDGSRALTGNWHDGTVTLWDLDRGEIVSFGGNRGTVRSVAFSASGRIASADSNGFHLIRDATPVSLRSEPRDSAAFERGLEDGVRPLVERLFAELILPDDVEAALREDPSLDESQRAVALRMARNQRFDARFTPGTPMAWALETLAEPGRPRETYERALRVVETVGELWSDPDDSRTLALSGFARVRLGEYEDALYWLDRADENQVAVDPLFPTGARNIGLFRAMAEVRLGLDEDARARLDELPPTLPTDADPFDLGLQRRLLAEARELLDG